MEGNEQSIVAEYVAAQNEKLPGKEKEGQCMMESLLLWDEMDDETESQKILELRAASQVDMQKNLIREIWLNVNDLLRSYLRKQKKPFLSPFFF